MADKPILFSAPMVRAILREIEAPGTGKTQTRRLLRPQPDYRGPSGCMDDYEEWGWMDDEGGHLSVLDIWPNRLSVGDRFWVREAWRSCKDYDAYPPIGMMDCPIHYEADGGTAMLGRRRPSIHMPRWASRLTLHVTDVRVQRLQDISEADARAEGLSKVTKDGQLWKFGIPDLDGLPGNDDFGWNWTDWKVDARSAFQRLWDSLNAKRAPWPRNPWVVAVTFRPVLGNIDGEGGR
ncbi:MAG: hypothetical protein ACK5LJ_09140 [Paracoccus sp. (in: a-proteobacteria)]